MYNTKHLFTMCMSTLLAIAMVTAELPPLLENTLVMVTGTSHTPVGTATATFVDDHVVFHIALNPPYYITRSQVYVSTQPLTVGAQLESSAETIEVVYYNKQSTMDVSSRIGVGCDKEYSLAVRIYMKANVAAKAEAAWAYPTVQTSYNYMQFGRGVNFRRIIADCGCYSTQGILCNDDIPCTVDECIEGSCRNTVKNCSDDDMCTQDYCNAVTGACYNVPLDCADDDLCTIDYCEGGSCRNDVMNCDDGDMCTSDVCVGGVCQNTPLDCNDHNDCTVDMCVDGQCQYEFIC